MNKKNIDVNEYAGVILNAIEKGVCLTTKSGEKINSMLIGWGHLGRIWERPVFIAYVRKCRYTHEMLQQNPEFTVNVPLGQLDRQIFKVCGTQSGRDMDKIKEAGLTPVPPEVISVPGLKELPLTLECRVLFQQELDDKALPEEIRRAFYTMETADHVAYYGLIEAAYLIED